MAIEIVDLPVNSIVMLTFTRPGNHPIKSTQTIIFLWVFYRFPMIFPFSHGFPMVFLWFLVTPRLIPAWPHDLHTASEKLAFSRPGSQPSTWRMWLGGDMMGSMGKIFFDAFLHEFTSRFIKLGFS